MKFKAASVKLVRPALGNDIDYRTLVAAILCREVIGDDLEFLHCVLVVDEEAGTAN